MKCIDQRVLTVVFFCVFIFMSACAGEKGIEIPDIPTINFGSTPMTMNGAGVVAPADQYQEAFLALRKQHYLVTRDLRTNSISVREALKSIIRHMRIMQTMIKEPESSGIAAYIVQYEKIAEQFNTKRYSGLTISTFGRYEKEVRSQFAMDKVTYVEEAPQSEGSDLPAFAKSGSLPLPEDVTTTHETPSTDAIPIDIFVDSLLKRCGDLLQAYRGSENSVKEKFQKVKEAFQVLFKHLSQEDQGRLKIYMNEFDRIYRDTGGFSKFPKGGTKEDVVRELTIATQEMGKMFAGKKQSTK